MLQNERNQGEGKQFEHDGSRKGNDGGSRVEESSLESEGKIVFATAENYVDCGVYLGQTLSMHGFVHEFETDFKSVKDKVAACNCLYDLIRDRQRLQQLREDLTVEVTRSQGRNRDISRILEQTKAELIKARRQHWIVEERLSLLQKESRAAEKKLKLQMNKLSKENVMIRNRDKGYQAKIRKIEHEAVRLKDKLDRAQRARKGLPKDAKIEIVSAVKRGKKTSGSSNGDEQLMKETLSAYERKNSELAEENARLRADFHSYQQKLDGILDRKVVQIELSKSMEDALAEFNPCMFDMPYDIVEKYISNGLDARLLQVRRQMELIDTRSAEIEVANAEQLAEVVNEQRAILKETDYIMRSHLLSGQEKGELHKQHGRNKPSMADLKSVELERAALEELKVKYVKHLVEVDEMKLSLKKELADQNEMEEEERKRKSEDEKSKTSESGGLLAYIKDEAEDGQQSDVPDQGVAAVEEIATLGTSTLDQHVMDEIERILQTDDSDLFSEMVLS
eukprot:jgi/Bigna1/66325/fgenesh1_pg.1_\